MKLVKSLLLGSAVGLIGAAGAQAADLPTRKSAPVEYVRICDAYGAGFFYIPGTDTCLKIGGLVLGEVRSWNQSYSVSVPYAGNGSGTATAKGATLAASAYSNQRERDAYGYAALGRIELDTRTATAWGTLRTFARVDAYYGSGSTASTGSLQQGIAGTSVINTSANTNIARYTTILNKAFIQFGGLTAGYAQSIFDFYADAYNFEGLRGSNATVGTFAYTATFGSGFSASIAVEDQQSRRTNIGSVIVAAAPVTAVNAGDKYPDITANLRYDAAWGAVQASGAAHSSRTTTFLSTATGVPLPGAASGLTTPAFPTGASNSYGFAAQLGVMFNLDMLSPGDKLWLQATYEKGAESYVDGSNLTFADGAVNGNRAPGNTTPTYGNGWQFGQDYDCVWTAAGSCEQQNGYAMVAAFKHYWIPTLSSALYGSFLRFNYSANAINGVGGGIGATSHQETRIGTNLIWTPVKGFDIGGEFMYMRNTVLTGGPNFVIPAGFPAFTASVNTYEGRIRVQRAF